MKKLISLLVCVVLCLTIPRISFAYEKAKTKVATVKQKGNQVIFTLTSSKKFVTGGNDYILFIGNRHFEENKNLSSNGKGVMNFYLSDKDFNSLQEGDNIYLTYGHIANDEEHEGEQLEEYGKQNNKRVWPLGKFSTKMLTK